MFRNDKAFICFNLLYFIFHFINLVILFVRYKKLCYVSCVFSLLLIREYKLTNKFLVWYLFRFLTLLVSYTTSGENGRSHEEFQGSQVSHKRREYNEEQKILYFWSSISVKLVQYKRSYHFKIENWIGNKVRYSFIMVTPHQWGSFLSIQSRDISILILPRKK